MKIFLLSLLVVVSLTAALGWLTHFAHARAGKPGQKLCRGFLSILYASVLLFLMFIANYWLASTALARIWGQEPLGADPVLRLIAGSGQSASASASFSSLSGGSSNTGLKSNHIVALVLVLSSFLACAWFLKSLGKTAALLRSEGWENPVNFSLTIATLLVATFVAYRILHTDLNLLLFRSAQMMFSEQYDGASAIPDFNHLVANFPNTMAASLLLSLFWWYPLTILLVEKHWATCWSAFSEAITEFHASPAPALATPVVAPANITRVAIPPRAARPRVEPVTRTATARAPDPVITIPIDGVPIAPGAAPWVRPAPFNEGPTPANNSH